MLLVVVSCTGYAVRTVAAAIDGGERLYREGILPGGVPLVGSRDAGAPIAGAAAACVNCHHRSGLGASEGSIAVPPIIGAYLFKSSAELANDADAPHLPGYASVRPAYTEATLARAIREGVASDGRPLHYLMPRYDLTEEALAALTGYLRRLGEPPRGVEPGTLHFATVVTPEADAVEREAMREVLEHFFAAHNATIAGQRRPAADGNAVYQVQRRWQLSIWTLTGRPEGWAAQLDERFRAEPVMALISGSGGRHWRPMHEFCEAAGVACLLPNVPVPVVAAANFHSVYFSRGVLLEADLMAHQLALLPRAPGQSRAAGAPRVVQIYRAGTAGEDGAVALRRLGRSGARDGLSGGGSADVQWVLPEHDREPRNSLGRLIRGVRDADVVVLWLSAEDLARLPAQPAGRAVLVSGLLGGLDAAPLPAAWRAVTAMSYPFELPETRRAAVAFTRGWLRLQNIAAGPERIQSDTYLACQIMTEALDGMLDSYFPDFLVERVESMLSSRLVNGYYPRLGLGTGQRFASKGGYVVRFAGPGGTAVRTDAAWIVP